MSKQVKYIIKNDKTNEVYANGEFVEMYDGEEFTLFDTEDEAKQFIHHNLARRLQLLSVSESWREIAFSPFYIKLNFH